MKVFCIDPFLLAYPRFDGDISQCEADFENYLDSLIAWRDFINNNRNLEIYISFRTAEVLANVNGYPEWDELEKIINHSNFKGTLQPHDIHNVINSILTLPCIEDKTNIKEILYDCEQIQCNPSEYLLEREPIFQENYYRIAIFICLLETLLNRNCQKTIATRHRTNNSQSIIIKAEILDYDLNDESTLIALTKPYVVEGNLTYCVDPEYLSTLYDSTMEQAVDIWKNGTSEKSYIEAITIYINDFNAQLQQPKSENNILSWSFGSQFLTTVENLGFMNEDRKIKMLLRCCVEIILEENLQDTHWLRKGKGGNNPQRERKTDNAKAWRRDIDYEYHLHYWKTKNNDIEFASVVTHNDMKIPD